MTDAAQNVTEELEETQPVEAEAKPEQETEETQAQEQSETQDEVTEESSTKTDSKDEEPEWFKKRIDRFTRDMRDLEREKDYWRQQATQKAEPPKPEPVQEKLKTLEDFDYDEGKYSAYLFQAAETRAVEAAKRAIMEDQGKASAQRLQAEFQQAEDKFAETAKDYMQVTRDPQFPLNQAMHETMMELDNGPQVMYHLAKHQDIASRIYRMSDRQIAAEIGRLSERLQKPPAPSVSKAPEPPPKLQAKSPSQAINPASADSDKLSTREWLKRRNKQLERR